MMRLPTWLSQHVAALRALLVFTVLTGLAYPLLITGVAQLPGLRDQANGSLLSRDDKVVGSRIIGQHFTDPAGNPLVQYFQSRPSAAGDGYDPTSTAASNRGPEDVVDTLPDPNAAPDTPEAQGRQSLLTQVCSRSKAVGELEGVDGRRPYCTDSGVGAVFGVFHRDGLTGPIRRVVSLNQTEDPFLTTYRGVTVEPAKPGEDYSQAVVTPIRGDTPVPAVVPADAVTASGSGLDPHISLAYATLQADRIASVRDIEVDAVMDLIDAHTSGRALGFMGEAAVNVLELNLELDREHPYQD